MRIEGSEFRKQVIYDEELQSIVSLLDPVTLAYDYVVKGKTQIDMDAVQKAYYNEVVLKPYLQEYIKLKEKYLGKSRLLFSKKEKQETLEELESLYHKLKKERLVY
ncbi:MAG: hypothetical protein ACRCX2_33685 [Paraclostridium sp.]